MPAPRSGSSLLEHDAQADLRLPRSAHEHAGETELRVRGDPVVLEDLPLVGVPDPERAGVQEVEDLEEPLDARPADLEASGHPQIEIGIRKWACSAPSGRCERRSKSS